MCTTKYFTHEPPLVTSPYFDTVHYMTMHDNCWQLKVTSSTKKAAIYNFCNFNKCINNTKLSFD